MANDAGSPAKTIASTLIFGLLGAGLVYYGRRSKPGILATLSTTAGYGLISRAVSETIFASLAPPSEV